MIPGVARIQNHNLSLSTPMPKKRVAIIGSGRAVINEVDRKVARQMVADGEAVWWNGGRSIRLLEEAQRIPTSSEHLAVVSGFRGKSAQPGQRSIERYAEARAAIPDDRPNEASAAADCWAGKVK